MLGRHHSSILNTVLPGEVARSWQRSSSSFVACFKIKVAEAYTAMKPTMVEYRIRNAIAERDIVAIHTIEDADMLATAL